VKLIFKFKAKEKSVDAMVCVYAHTTAAICTYRSSYKFSLNLPRSVFYNTSFYFTRLADTQNNWSARKAALLCINFKFTLLEKKKTKGYIIANPFYRHRLFEEPDTSELITENIGKKTSFRNIIVFFKVPRFRSFVLLIKIVLS